ncbi:hypothetical protein DFH28DRAFT_997742 [Melampsora americana]|nr:hypothetical protein DFH28DRAFT_997742 [Melampsora americana]
MIFFKVVVFAFLTATGLTSPTPVDKVSTGKSLESRSEGHPQVLKKRIPFKCPSGCDCTDIDRPVCYGTPFRN